MDRTRLKTALEAIRESMPSTQRTDSALAEYYVILRNRDGEIVDKQPLSRIVTLVYDYVMQNAWQVKQALDNYNPT